MGTGRIFGEQSSGTRLPVFSGYPFTLGVASGDPDAEGFVLWTRLAPSPLQGGGMPSVPVKVQWRVCEDEAMTKVVAKGEAGTSSLASCFFRAAAVAASQPVPTLPT